MSITRVQLYGINNVCNTQWAFAKNNAIYENGGVDFVYRFHCE